MDFNDNTGPGDTASTSNYNNSKTLFTYGRKLKTGLWVENLTKIIFKYLPKIYKFATNFCL